MIVRTLIETSHEIEVRKFWPLVDRNVEHKKPSRGNINGGCWCNEGITASCKVSQAYSTVTSSFVQKVVTCEMTEPFVAQIQCGWCQSVQGVKEIHHIHYEHSRYVSAPQAFALQMWRILT